MTATLRSLLLLGLLGAAAAFAPAARTARLPARALAMADGDGNFGMKPERTKLTRESEPDEFFSTNTDKMSDEEKLPIAIMGLVGISAPFILGLIALYAAK